MNLVVTTPFAVVVEAAEVSHLYAEDATGGFGILPGHADFLTALSVSVASWRDKGGGEHHVALKGGMLSVTGGERISIATPEAVAGDDLGLLESEVLARFRERQTAESQAMTDTRRLTLAAIRQIYRSLRPDESFPAGGRFG